MTKTASPELSNTADIVPFSHPAARDDAARDVMLDHYNQLSRIVMNALALAHQAEAQRSALARAINDQRIRTCQQG